MTRDYKNTPRAYEEPQGWFGWPWLGTIAILGLGMIIYQYYQQSQDEPVPLPKAITPSLLPSPSQQPIAQQPIAQQPVAPAATEVPPAVVVQPVQPTPPRQYDFYEALPKEPITLPSSPGMENNPKKTKPDMAAVKPSETKPEITAKKEVVKAPKPEIKPEAKPVPPVATAVATPVKPNKPYLQVGAFQKLEQAQQHKAKLAALGFNASVKTVQKEQATWYRVYVGPYADEAGLDAAQRKLQEHNITYLRSP